MPRARAAAAVVTTALVTVIAVLVTGARPATAGPFPSASGTGVPTGPPPTLRPWISATYYPRDPGAGLVVPVVVVTGGGFAVLGDGTRSATVTVSASPTRVWGGYRLLRLDGREDCGDSAVLGPACRYYQPGELRPLDVLILSAQAAPEPGCRTRLGVQVSFDGSVQASTALFVPCTVVTSP